jgi:RNAse (barnase) inhibitor barstar
MIEELFWETMRHLESQAPGFGRAGSRFKPPRGFKRTIHAVDSSTIQLVADCMDWAKHRRRKAAAKLHLTLNLNSFLPSFAVVDTAKDSDASRAAACCAHLRDGEIVVFDRAYVILDLLADLDERGVFWVTRSKKNMKFRCVKKLIRKPTGNILRDDLVVLSCKGSKKKYQKRFRRIVAIVEVRGKPREMTFISNNLDWAPGSICDLYRCRWDIETFFREIKQTLQIADFYGHNKNAVKWQIWSALLAYILLRYLKHLSKWPHSFVRLFTSVRAVVWRLLDLPALLKPDPGNGTALGGTRICSRPEQLYLPGIASIEWDSTL